MTAAPTNPQDVRELALQAVWATRIRDTGQHDDGLPRYVGATSEEIAAAVLAAVEPVIRQQVAEEIAWHIEHPIGPQEVRWAPIARRWMAEAAAIARSHSTAALSQPSNEGDNHDAG